MSGRPRGSLRLVHKGVEVTGTFSPVVSYALSHGGAGIVGSLTARNTSKRRSSAFTIALSLEPYGAPCSLEVRPLSAGSEQLLDCPALVLDAKPLAHLQLPRPAGLVLGVSGKPESNTRYESQVLGQWDWVVDTSTESLKALAAFVSPRNPHVEQMALWAQEMLPAEAGGQTFRELLKGVAPECPEREILRCLYRYLAERCHIGYEEATARTVSGTEVVYQRIRRPQEVLQGWNGVIWGWGTCIDLAVLMAGCLEKADVAPLLILTSVKPESSVPDHAFMGCWKGTDGGRPIIRSAEHLAQFRSEVERGNAWVVECTGVTKGAHRTRLSFEEAVVSATEQLSRDRVWIVDVGALRPPQVSGVSGTKDWVTPMDSPEEREGGMARLQKVLTPLDFLTEASRHTHTFTGRRWLFEELESWLQGGGDSRIFWLAGGPGVGKSAVAMALLQRRDVVASHFCVDVNQDKRDAKRMVLSLAYQLATHLDDYRRHLEALNLEEETLKDAPTLFENLIVQPLRACSDPGHPLLVVVDGVDEATGTDGNAIARLIASQWNQTPDWLKLVITSRPEGAVQMPLQGLRGLNPVMLDAESPENLEDLRGFITGELRAPGHEPESRVVDVLLEKSEGMFLYAVLVLEEVRDKPLSLEDADSLPKGLYGYYAWCFCRQFPEVAAYQQEVRPLLEVIVAQRGPLPLALLARATGTTVNKLAPRFLKLGSLFPVRPSADTELCAATIQPFHKSVSDWLTGLNETYLPIAGAYAVDQERGEATLTKACWEEYRGGCDKTSVYTLQHLPACLAETGRLEDLVVSLTDVFFLEAKAKAGMVFDLVVDFSKALAVLPRDHVHRRIVALLREALRRDVHFLARHIEECPHVMFQCFWNSCWWYDCPDAARHYLVPEEAQKNALPWERPGPKLYELMEKWRRERNIATPGFLWVRSMRPPAVPLGAGQQAVLRGHEGAITTVSFSPNGRRIASGSYDETVRIWDAETGAELVVLRGHECEITTLAYSPDGCRIATNGGSYGHWDERYEKTVRVWDAETGNELFVLYGHDGYIRTVSYSPDGRRIVGGSSDSTVRVWDVETGAEVFVLRGHKAEITTVSYSRDGNRIVSSSYDGAIRTWDAETGKALLVLRAHDWWASNVSYSPDGHRIVSGSVEGIIQVWDADTGVELLAFKGDPFSIRSVSYSPDCRRIVSGGGEGTVHIWDAETGAERAVLRGHAEGETSVSYSPDGCRIASGGTEDATIEVWDTETPANRLVLRGHENNVDFLSYSPDGRRIVSGSDDKTVRVWDAETGAELYVLHGHESHVVSVSYSPDSRRIVSGTDDATVWVWDAETGVELRVLLGHKEGPVSAWYSSDGQCIISLSETTGEVIIWDAKTYSELYILYQPDGRGDTFCSLDGHLIACAIDDKHLRLRDATTGDVVLDINPPVDITDEYENLETIAERFCPFRDEIRLRNATTDESIAFFPVEIDHIACDCTDARRWAGSHQSNLYLIRLELG